MEAVFALFGNLHRSYLPPCGNNWVNPAGARVGGLVCNGGAFWACPTFADLSVLTLNIFCRWFRSEPDPKLR